jgi:hypothetical protein
MRHHVLKVKAEEWRVYKKVVAEVELFLLCTMQYATQGYKHIPCNPTPRLQYLFVQPLLA